MNKIDVTFTTDAYSCDFDTHYDLEQEAKTALATRVSEITVEGQAIDLVSASASCDDTVHPAGRDEDGSVKLFVNVVLRMPFSDEDEARDYDPDDAIASLLGEIAATMLPGGDIEQNWEVLETETVVLQPGMTPG